MAAQNPTKPLDEMPDTETVKFINETEVGLVRARCNDCNRDLGFWKKPEIDFYCSCCGQMHGW